MGRSKETSGKTRGAPRAARDETRGKRFRGYERADRLTASARRYYAVSEASPKFRQIPLTASA